MSADEQAGPLKRRFGETRRIWSRSPRNQVEAPQLPAAQIDEPRPGTTLDRGFVHLAGWALTDAGPVDRIDVTVNGEDFSRARLGITRKDLPKTFVIPTAMLGGFHCVLDLSELPETVDSVTITGRATAGSGDAFDLPTVVYELANREEVIDPDPARSAVLRERGVVRVPAGDSPGSAGKGLKILAVTHNIALGGGQLVMLELLRRFGDEHNMSGAVIAPKDGATRDDLEEAGFEVHITGEYPVEDIETYEARLAELAAWAAPQEFDLVLVNTVLSFVGGDLAGRLGLPAVWIVHESYGLDGFWATFQKDALHPYVRERGAKSFSDAAAVIFEVDATLELFRKSAGDAPLVSLPYGIDIAGHDRQIAKIDREAERLRLGYSPEEFIVLCMGTIEPRKGQIQLVEAFSRIADAHQDARLVLVGALDNGYDAEVEKAAELLGVTGQIDIHPVTPDITPFYAAADLLVCASDIESLPRTVLEAMVFRLPVMATDVFGLPEVIEDGRTGWIVESRDTASLAAGLTRAISASPEQRAEIAEAARRVVEEEHDSPACSARYAEVLRRAVAGSREGSVVV